MRHLQRAVAKTFFSNIFKDEPLRGGGLKATCVFLCCMARSRLLLAVSSSGITRRSKTERRVGSSSDAPILICMRAGWVAEFDRSLMAASPSTSDSRSANNTLQSRCGRARKHWMKASFSVPPRSQSRNPSEHSTEPTTCSAPARTLRLLIANPSPWHLVEKAQPWFGSHRRIRLLIARRNAHSPPYDAITAEEIWALGQIRSPNCVHFAPNGLDGAVVAWPADCNEERCQGKHLCNGCAPHGVAPSFCASRPKAYPANGWCRTLSSTNCDVPILFRELWHCLLPDWPRTRCRHGSFNKLCSGGTVVVPRTQLVFQGGFEANA